MDKSLLIIAAIAILALFLVISIVKKAIKLVLFILIIIIGISAVDVFVYGVSPVDEISAYKTNIEYGKDVADLTGKINSSITKIKDQLGKANLDSTSIEIFKQENDNLHSYKNQFDSFKHTKGLNDFNNTYSSYLNNIIGISDSIVSASSSGKKTINDAQDVLNRLKNEADKLSNLKQ